MLAHIAHASLRHASRIAPSVAPVAAKALSARFATRFMSSTHYAVDAPDGDHDLQDIVSTCIFAFLFGIDSGSSCLCSSIAKCNPFLNQYVLHSFPIPCY